MYSTDSYRQTDTRNYFDNLQRVASFARWPPDVASDPMVWASSGLRFVGTGIGNLDLKCDFCGYIVSDQQWRGKPAFRL